MGATLQFEWDSRDLEVWRGGKIDRALNRALRLAGNKGARVMQRGSSDYITSHKNIRMPEVKKGTTLDLPRPSASLTDFVWSLWVSGAPVPLSKFPHIDTRQRFGAGRGRGVLVRVNVGKGTSRVAHAFVATMRSGHEGIFRRRGKAHLPIDELFTTRLADSMRDPGVAITIETQGYRKLVDAFKANMAREVGKLRKAGAA